MAPPGGRRITRNLKPSNFQEVVLRVGEPASDCPVVTMARELVSLDQLCKGECNMAAVEPHSIRLDQFLKSNSMVGTGGQAKLLIQEGLVRVNGEIETRRRRKLRGGDVVEVGDQRLVVESGMEH